MARTIDFTVPEGAHIRATSAEFAELDPAEYRADVVVRVDDEHDQARDIFIIEIQLDIDKKKHYSWPHYVTGARNRFCCPATLVVITLDERVAEWSSAPIVLDRAGSAVKPVVIGAAAIPVITEPESPWLPWPRAHSSTTPGRTCTLISSWPASTRPPDSHWTRSWPSTTTHIRAILPGSTSPKASSKASGGRGASR